MTEVRCPICKRKEMVDTETLRHQDTACCGGAVMLPTGMEEHDGDYAREQNDRRRR